MKAEAIAKKIKLVCLDVDGVLTDGSIIISGQGELFKQFYVRDGLGIKFLQDCGIQVAICTGRQSDIVIERAKELGITLLMQGQKDKREGLAEICRQAGVSPEETAYMGDDIPDLECMREVGIPVCPADAAAEVIEASRYVSEFRGGEGAVRDIVEQVLRARGDWARDSMGVTPSSLVASR